MHRLSAAAPFIGLGLVLGGCGSVNPPLAPDVSIARGMKLVFEHVCMPAVLDGENFAALAKARLMTPMDPATRGAEQATDTFRLAYTGVSVSFWQDGSCVVGAQRGDTAQLQAQTLAALKDAGHAMTPGVSGQPAVNAGVGAAWCSADARPVILALTTPGASGGHALIATLHRSTDAAHDLCRAAQRT